MVDRMVVVVVLLAVVTAAAMVTAFVARRRANEQRRLASAADERARQADERAQAAQEATAAADERARQADERAQAAQEATAAAEDQARQADERAATLAGERDQARRDAEDAAAARRAATGGLDPDVLWVLERARSERTWRHSVALGPDSVSVFRETTDPLLEALQVELDAAREDVGAEVELDADLPAALTVAGSVLTLRAAQELLAGIVRRGEVTTLHVNADGRDVVVTVNSVDEDGEPVTPAPLPLPPSDDIVAVEDGVRIRGAIDAPD
jgi:uncharacterized protein (UPF0333 family)